MKIPKRRRRENKTNYSTRLKMLKSEKPRVVFRKTNKYIITEYIVSESAQDKVEIYTSSKDLIKAGWPEKNSGSLKSIPATYLTGLMMGKKIISEKKETPIVDIGMMRKSYKTKPFAFIKGLIDGGLEIPCKEEAFPEKERIEGGAMKEKVDIQKIKSNIEKE